jgi:hypothetical protein
MFLSTFLSDTNLAVYYNEPFWLRFLAHAAFFAGALYLAARLEADRLVKRASWRYWQLACLCLCLWNITSVNSVVLRESTDVGVVALASGEPIRGEMREEPMRGSGGSQQASFYYSLTEKADPLAEGARFVPIGTKGEIYYYLQFDTVLLVLAGVFGLLGLHDARRGAAAAAGPVDEVEEVPGA